jgi:hypothetical protein
MRIPVILMLFTIVLLPADLRGLVAQVESGVDVARASITKFLDRKDAVQVADAAPKLVLGGTAAQVQ